MANEPAIPTPSMGRGTSLILSAAVDASWVVEGGPGTGKTLFAIQRTTRTLAWGGRARLLVSSELLAQRLGRYIQEERGAANVVATWRTWLRQEHAEHGKTAVPRASSEAGRYDWPTIRRSWESWFSAPGSRYDAIVVDEAQAVPPEVLELARRAANDLFIFCDPYQRFEQDGADLVRMVEAVGIQAPWPVLALEEDFRTTREIQAFAHAMFATDREIPRIRPAPRRGPLPRVVAASQDSAASVAEAEAVAMASMDGVSSVAILGTHATRGVLSHAACRANRRLGSDVVETQAVAAVRGLDFDGVVLTSMRPRHENGSPIGSDLDMYIGATRARHALSLVHVPEFTPSSVRERLDDLRATDRIHFVGEEHP